ncbi:serine hydrolase domain-containing protein [Lutimonas halocynthiae]|uniref:serine hydrolase domain-containing protein n=1 Tax=Lutimonas halocynthiae TaxID=1446477 RepID=UPI0025B45840|nr:serine hydrolase domain-containing protein [Lutimonas halocynthiae]MDN3643150.1 serine hydrolase domain-containing protein [Lutimonas halocynthiae]
MKIRNLTFILLFNIITLTLTGQNTTDFEWPENEITPIFKEFVKAYNTNDLKKLEAFTSKHYEKDFKKAAAYWPSVFADYGQIEAFSEETSWSDKNRLAIWFHGKHTKNWVIIMLRMNPENTKIIGKSVSRGSRPSGNLPPYSRVSSKEMKPYLKKYLKKLHKLDHFSGSVLVAKGNTILFEESYGERNKKRNTKNNANTSFNIASTTKTFTGVAIAKLAEQGKLKFTDPISKFIPEYPKDISNQVTIHHLLTHTSGIELDDYEPFNLDNDKAKNLNEALKAQVTHLDSLNEGRRKNFKVLNKYDYSNEEFVLLGIIIERVSGMSYGECIEQSIFKPLNMKNSFADIHKLTTHQNKAIGYTYKDTESNFIGGTRCENGGVGLYLAPDGGIYSTTTDLYTYFKAINTHTIVSKGTQELLHKKHAKFFVDKDESRHYGYGFQLNQVGEAITIGHGGTYPGVGSRFEYYPKENYYVIVLSNYGSMAGSAVAAHIKDLIEPNH